MLIVLCLLALAAFSAGAQGTAFTYQGRLNDGNAPANGSYDLHFNLYPASNGSTPNGPTLTNSATAISNGLFTATLDFGSNIFSGASLWVELGVRTNGNGTFTTLSPRQQLTAVPYAIFAAGAATAASAATVTGVLPGASLAGAYGGTVALNNAANQFVGTFSGNGTWITNVTASAIRSPNGTNSLQAAGNNFWIPANGFLLMGGGSSVGAGFNMFYNSEHSGDPEMQFGSAGSFAFTPGQGNQMQSVIQLGSARPVHEIIYVNSEGPLAGADAVPGWPDGTGGKPNYAPSKLFAFSVATNGGNSILLGIRGEYDTNSNTGELSFYNPVTYVQRQQQTSYLPGTKRLTITTGGIISSGTNQFGTSPSDFTSFSGNVTLGTSTTPPSVLSTQAGFLNSATYCIVSNVAGNGNYVVAGFAIEDDNDIKSGYTATYGSTPMTLIATTNTFLGGAAWQVSYVFGLANAPGTNHIVITNNATGASWSMAGGAVVLKNASGVLGAASDSRIGTGLTNTVTSSSRTLVLDFATVNHASNNFISQSGQTKILYAAGNGPALHIFAIATDGFIKTNIVTIAVNDAITMSTVACDGITTSATITGNGGGLTNLQAASLVGGLTTNITTGSYTLYITNGLILRVSGP